ncbi:cell division protein FtsB [Deinococcus radiotolerans]|uniref:cell division protein FtsB n=1 Tax=Deinococcus radiotolerans TaxID=1309407 RepID=UPI001E374D62|nr:cell division protein FtsB [Deinococcus radiotolerans]
MTDLPPPPPPRRDWWRRLQRLPLSMMIASALLALGIVQLTFQLGHSLYRTSTWTRDTQATQARTRELERDIEELQDAVKYTQTPEHLQELARCLGYVGVKEKKIVALNAPTVDRPTEICKTLRVP